MESSWNNEINKPVQYQGKLMMETSENGKKPDFKPNFEPRIIFWWGLPLLVRNCPNLSPRAI